MAQLADLTALEVGTATGFHGDATRWHLAEISKNLISAQLLANDGMARAISSMHLKHVLRQIEADCGNFLHDRPPMWNVANPPWHIDAIGGRLQHQRHLPLKLGEKLLNFATGGVLEFELGSKVNVGERRFCEVKRIRTTHFQGAVIDGYNVGWGSIL